MQTSVVLHRAPWLISMTGPVVPDGAVAVQEGRIVGCGAYNQLRRDFSGARVDEYPGHALMPGLVNSHIHLELSHLAHLSQGPPATSFTSWIMDMLAERQELGFVGSHVEAAALSLLQDQYDSGVIAIADIGNTGLARELIGKAPCLLLPFLEFLGLSRASLVPALKKLEQTKENEYCTAHAPYSTHPELIRALKRRANRLDHPFPIHVAEPATEKEMLREGKGELTDFLRQRGFYDESFRPAGIDIGGSVQYLHEIGVLDKRTLCVHAIHLDDGEIQLLRKQGAKVCICPGSNRFLQVGKAPVAKYLRHGILPALGTDSVASNPKVTLWREIRLLAEEHPEVAPDQILKMATLGGAVALGVETGYGSLAQGKSGRFLAVPVDAGVRDGQEVCACLVSKGSGLRPRWVDV